MNKIYTKGLFSILLPGALILLLTLVGEQVNSILRFTRGDILAGEVWRIVSAHFVHLNFAHGIMNLAAFFLISLLVGAQLRPIYWFISVSFMAVLIGISLLVFSPQVQSYVGFSGILHGLLALGLVLAICTHKVDDSSRQAHSLEARAAVESPLLRVKVSDLTFARLSNALKSKRLDWLLLLLLTYKVASEQLPEFDFNHLHSVIGASVIVDAHLYGFISGLCLALFFVLLVNH